MRLTIVRAVKAFVPLAMPNWESTVFAMACLRSAKPYALATTARSPRSTRTTPENSVSAATRSITVPIESTEPKLLRGEAGTADDCGPDRTPTPLFWRSLLDLHGSGLALGALRENRTPLVGGNGARGLWDDGQRAVALRLPGGCGATVHRQRSDQRVAAWSFDVVAAEVARGVVAQE